MITRDKLIAVMLLLLAMLYLASGTALYFFALPTFESLPNYYGEFNSHFVKDAGLAFSSSAILLLLAVFNKSQRFIYSMSASLFVVFHGLFHVQMLLMGMVPTDFIVYELLRVILPATVLLILVAVIYHHDKQAKSTQ